MGTRFNLVLPGVDNTRGEDIYSQLIEELIRIENMLSCYREDSEITMINNNAYDKHVAISDEVLNILVDCELYKEKSSGAFNMCLGKYIDHWKDETNIKGSSSPSGMAKDADYIIDQENVSIRFVSPHTKINLGGYGKGYALQKAQQMLSEKDINSAFLSFGDSSICCIGKHPYGDYWPVGIQDPFDEGKAISTLNLMDQSISTSGKLGKHNVLIRPEEGIPLDENKLVTVLASSPLEAEVLSTALIVSDEQQEESIKKTFPDIAIISVEFKNRKSYIHKHNLA